jgi:phototropin
MDQGDVQYFIGVQLDGTERVPDAAAKDGAMLVCSYLLKIHQY